MEKRKLSGYDIDSQPILYDVDIFPDRRGYFKEVYNEKTFMEKTGLDKIDFIQDNVSMSIKGVIRGMHFQWEHPQDKLITVLKGYIVDKIIDIRPESPNFGKVYTYHLSQYNRNVLFVPRGFAHGFMACEDDTLVMYKVSSAHRIANDEGSIYFNDKNLNLGWLEESSAHIKEHELIVSDRDKSAMLWKDFVNMVKE